MSKPSLPSVEQKNKTNYYCCSTRPKGNFFFRPKYPSSNKVHWVHTTCYLRQFWLRDKSRETLLEYYTLWCITTYMYRCGTHSEQNRKNLISSPLCHVSCNEKILQVSVELVLQQNSDTFIEKITRFNRALFNFCCVFFFFNLLLSFRAFILCHSYVD